MSKLKKVIKTVLKILFLLHDEGLLNKNQGILVKKGK